MHLNRYLLFTIPIILSSTIAANAQLSIDELYTSPQIIGTAPRSPVWSPDSTTVAFLWNDAGIEVYDVWLSKTDAVAPTRLTTSETSISAVSWHPSGDSLVFERGGELFSIELGQPGPAPAEKLAAGSNARYAPDGRLVFLRDGDVWILEDGGETRLVGDDRGEIRIQSYRFNADGDAIAVLELDERRVPVRGIPDYLEPETTMVPVRRPLPGEEPRSMRLGVVSLDSGEPRWLDRGAPPTDPIFSYRWSPRGHLLVDHSDLYVKSRKIISIDPASSAVTEIVREDDEGNVTAYWQAEWAPDGRGVYFLSDRDDYYHIYLAASPGETPQRITEGPFAVARFTVSSDAIHFIANAPRPEERHLFRIGLGGGEAQQRTREPGTHNPIISPDGKHAADIFSSDAMPPELFVVSEGNETRVTQSPLPAFYEHSWIGAQYVTFESHVDGTTLYGRLLLPPGLDESGQYPVIMGSVYANTLRNQWGGRTAHPLWGLDQHLLQKGYIVFSVDVRGSWGHGRDYRRRLRLDYGGIDVEDLHSGVHYLESLGYADTSRIGLWGSSYGGLMTAMSLFKKPGVYAAGVAAAPATNVFHALTGEMRVMMAPQDEPERYEAASAFTHASGLADPLLIIHGMRDRVVLYKDSLALVQKLMELGKSVDLVTLPNAPHAWDRHELYQTRFAFKKLVEHFDRHVKGANP